jgi:uncharacterized protein YPO0396
MGGHISNKDIQYQPFTLGDIGVIELLISFRSKYDDNLFLGCENVMNVTGGAAINEEVIITYMDLDRLIERCNFDDIQLKLIDMISFDYTYEEIAKATELTIGAIRNRLNTIYKKIKEENDRDWRKAIYTNKLELKTKKCSKCKIELPATDEFYSINSSSKDGHHSMCKKCKK